MKFVSYRMDGDGVDQLGVLTEDCEAVLPVQGLEDIQPGQALLRVIEDWQTRGTDQLRLADQSVPLCSVRLQAPLARPRRNIFCVGKNYREHAEEFDRSGFDASRDQQRDDVPAEPIFFTKTPTSVIGPGATIDPHPDLTTCLDYEAEICVIIGRTARCVKPEDAYDHVWGYVLLNDVTARDLQRDRKQWFLGKSLDTFSPMGPWAVTADEVDPRNIEIESLVNDEQRQKANTTDLIFDIPTLIADLTRGITLEPGDLIATGTPAGVGVGFDPPRFLKSGDVVRVKAAGLGELVNTVG
ncbi:MAG TPA: fumarylacetoacetate hydrolase family protein [Nocardioidaceae bacterium]|nr:fumarylacetoacetate hydrolase family protein [Nocardioidaceae bacterium]